MFHASWYLGSSVVACWNLSICLDRRFCAESVFFFALSAALGSESADKDSASASSALALSHSLYPSAYRLSAFLRSAAAFSSGDMGCSGVADGGGEGGGMEGGSPPPDAAEGRGPAQASRRASARSVSARRTPKRRMLRMNRSPSGGNKPRNSAGGGSRERYGGPGARCNEARASWWCPLAPGVRCRDHALSPREPDGIEPPDANMALGHLGDPGAGARRGGARARTLALGSGRVPLRAPLDVGALGSLGARSLACAGPLGRDSRGVGRPTPRARLGAGRPARRRPRADSAGSYPLCRGLADPCRRGDGRRARARAHAAGAASRRLVSLDAAGVA